METNATHSEVETATECSLTRCGERYYRGCVRHDGSQMLETGGSVGHGSSVTILKRRDGAGTGSDAIARTCRRTAGRS